MRLQSSTILLILMLLLGLLIRLWHTSDFATFRGDQAIELGSTLDILSGKFTLIGIKTSVSQVRNGAVMYYLLAPFLYLTRGHPVAGAILQTILQLISMVIVYIIGRHFATRRAGLMAAFFVMSSSLLVVFSRQTMLAQYPLIFCTLTLFVALSLARHFSLKWSFFLGVVLGVSLQVHYSTLSLLIFSLLFPFIFLRRFILRYFCALAIGIFLGLVPILVFELRHEFFNTKMLIEYFSTLTQSEMGIPYSISAYWINVLSILILGGNTVISIVVSGTLLLRRIFIRTRLSTVEAVSFLAIVSTMLFTFVFVHSFVPHYAISAFIPIFLILGIWICTIPKPFRLILAVPIIAVYLTYNTASYGWSATHGYMMSPGWSQRGVQRSSRIIFEDVKDRQYNVAMLIDGENQGLPLRYFLTLWGKQPLPVYAYDKAEFLYVVVERGLDIHSASMYELSAFGAFEVVRSWEVQNGIRLYKLNRQKAVIS